MRWPTPASSGRRVVSAFIATIFAQETPRPRRSGTVIADALVGEQQPRLGAMMDLAASDGLADMDFGRVTLATQISSTNPLERLNSEIKRRSDVVGIFPTTQPSSASSAPCMLETNDEWAVARRYMSLETLAPFNDDPTVRLPAVAA